MKDSTLVSDEDKGLVLVGLKWENKKREGRDLRFLQSFALKRSWEMKHLEEYMSLRNNYLLFCFNLEGISMCIYPKRNEVVKGRETNLQGRKMR